LKTYTYKGDVKLYLIEGTKGENLNNFGFIFLFKSHEAYKKWFGKEGERIESLWEEFMKNISDVMNEQNKYVKVYETTYTDWVVQ
jgi:hypothetical protein